MNELLIIVSLVVQIQGGKIVGTASGFFYVSGEVLYFVTNRHVVIDEEKKIRPDVLRLRLHTDANDLTKSVDVNVPLYRDGKPTWHLHPSYSTNRIDVAVVEIDQAKFKTGLILKALSSTTLLPSEYVIRPGEDVMVIGFPRGLSDTTHNLPLIRNAMVSSAYGINFQGSRLFLVDANLHPGMSGSPVITKPKNVWIDTKGNTNFLSGSPTYFLGVFSATLGVVLDTGHEEQLGLGAVWYANAIDEVIGSISKPAA